MEEKRTKHPGGRPRKEIAGRIAQEPDNGIFYTVPEAAELLGVHTHTIHRRIYAGELAAKKIGGIWRIYKSGLFQGKGGRKE